MDKENNFSNKPIILQIIFLVLGYLGLSILSLLISPLSSILTNYGIDSNLIDAIHLFVCYGNLTLIMIVILTNSSRFMIYLKKIIKDKKGIFEGIAIGAAIFACSTMYSLIVSWIFGNIGSNDNQSSLDVAFKASPLLIFFCVVIFAPITEELTYRYGLFGLLSRKSKKIGYILTTLIFALIHFNFTSTDMFTELISLPSYLIGALWLTYAYEKNDNILTSITAHSVYNLSQFILMCISAFVIQ